MADTIISLSLNSNVGTDVINFSTFFKATTNGVTGLTEGVGMASKIIGTSNVLLINLSSIPVDITGKKAILYIKNKSTVFLNSVNIIFGDTGGTYITALTLNGGEFAILPLSALADSDGSGTPADVNVIASASGTPIEYSLFYTI
jgi:hypothetical protein